MHWWKLSLRALAAVWLLSACGSAPSMTVPSSSPPPPLWQDVRELRILCLVNTPSGVDSALGGELCERARTIAGRGAPYPVVAIGLGDPAVLDPAGVTLLVHASLRPSPSGRLLALSVRPYRNSPESGALLFASAPRAAILPASGAVGAAADQELRAALSETLPWQADVPGARPLPQ